MGESLKEMTEVLSGLCVILEGGERAFGKGTNMIFFEDFKSNGLDGVGLNTFTKITEEEKIAIENDGDPLEAPPGPYTIQPDVPGKNTAPPTTIFLFLHQEKFFGSLGHLEWENQQLPKSLLGRMSLFTMRQTVLAC